MKVGYTEFSYGYSFTENLIRSSTAAPTGAPTFPNLLQESQSGFDVRIDFPGVPLFFQYKLPEVMRRGTAFEIAKSNCPGLTIPFFRISMMRSDLSRQHHLLMQLEKRYPACVFYAAGCLANLGEFNRAYNRAAVPLYSAFFSPVEIGALPDNKVHSIAYRPGLATAYFCSVPKQIVAHTYDGLRHNLQSQFNNDQFTDIRSLAKRLRHTVADLASASFRQIELTIEDRIRTSRGSVRADRSPEETRVITDVLVAREIARVDFGMDLLVVQPRP